MRGGLVAWLLWLMAAPLCAQVITSAEYNEPTTRYAHGVLGDAVEWGNMIVTVRRETSQPGAVFQTWTTQSYHLRLPEVLVYEDTAPRLADLDGDGRPEIIVVESHRDKGARLAVYGLKDDGVPALLAWTSFIGQRNRWMAPVGVADFDGDGTIDIAVVDRPHLARRLFVMRYGIGKMKSFAILEPVTNHRIGDDYISGGVRNCGAGPEMILLDAGWTQILTVRWGDGGFQARVLAPYEGRESVAQALAC